MREGVCPAEADAFLVRVAAGQAADDQRSGRRAGDRDHAGGDASRSHALVDAFGGDSDGDVAVGGQPDLARAFGLKPDLSESFKLSPDAQLIDKGA
jgi:hypothetical protein